jgi:hypothetical protein
LQKERESVSPDTQHLNPPHRTLGASRADFERYWRAYTRPASIEVDLAAIVAELNELRAWKLAADTVIADLVEFVNTRVSVTT